jgi:peroxiredoxin
LHQVARTTRVARLDDGGFYPAEGVIELRSPRPDVPPLPDVDQMIAGQPFNPPMLLESQWTWRATKIEARAGQNGEIYRPDFPQQTEWFRETRPAEQATEPLKRGQPAPPLHVAGWTDQKQRTLANFRGQVVVLYFWIAWQEPCMAPLGVIEELQRKFAARGLSVLGIHVGNVELDELRYATATSGVTFSNALDAGTDQTPGSTLASYHVKYYPTTVVIDRAGRIAWTSNDPANGELNARAARTLKIKLPAANERGPGLAPAEALRIFAVVLGEQIERELGTPPAKR